MEECEDRRGGGLGAAVVALLRLLRFLCGAKSALQFTLFFNNAVLSSSVQKAVGAWLTVLVDSSRSTAVNPGWLATMRRRALCSGRLLPLAVALLCAVNVFLYAVRHRQRVAAAERSVVDVDSGDGGEPFQSALLLGRASAQEKSGVALLVRDYDEWHHSLVPMADAVARAVGSQGGRREAEGRARGRRVRKRRACFLARTLAALHGGAAASHSTQGPASLSFVALLALRDKAVRQKGKESMLACTNERSNSVLSLPLIAGTRPCTVATCTRLLIHRCCHFVSLHSEKDKEKEPHNSSREACLDLTS